MTALDFPDTPTTGQLYGSEGIIWRWDGARWAAASSAQGVVHGYVHNQGVPAATWTITHNLGWHPNVTVIDSGGATVEGDITHLNAFSLSITFSGAFTGIAYLS